MERSESQSQELKSLQIRTDGDKVGASNRRKVKRWRVIKGLGLKKNMKRDIESFERKTVKFPRINDIMPDRATIQKLMDKIYANPDLDGIPKEAALRAAKIALEFFEKKQGVEYEIVQVLYSNGSRVRLPESGNTQLQGHVSFIAKPKIADCGIDASPKHFFGELFKDDRTGVFYATYCSTFEPSDDPEFNHGCILCSPQKFHPADGYSFGRYIQTGQARRV